MLPGDEETARQMHKKAINIKAKTQLLWANMKNAIAEPHFRSMRVSTTQESDRAALEQDIPFVITDLVGWVEQGNPTSSVIS